MATPDFTTAASTVGKRERLADLVRKLLRSGFVHNAKPVADMISMQRAWQGPDEDSVIVDVITVVALERAEAAREGEDGIPIWGPMRGGWSDVVAALLALPSPDRFVMVRTAGTSVPAAALPGGLS